MTNGNEFPGTSQGTVIESQIDWLTLGWDDGPKADRAEAWAFSRAQAERRAGYRELPFRLLGFDGWSVGRVRFGRRADAALLQLSGDLAESYADTVVAQADRLSRIDLAVTVRLAEPDELLGETTYAQAENHWQENHKRAQPWMIQDAAGGCTVYVGKRSSDRFLRVYNKEAESKDGGDPAAIVRYPNCWRYELELKGLAARPAALAAVGATDRPAFVQQYVHDYVSDHGIRAAFLPGGDRVLLPGFRRRSDYGTRLAWVRRSVNPALKQMLEEGDRAEILDALGLGPHLDP